MSKIMAVNAGSSSLKFRLFSMPEEVVICVGSADRIGHQDAVFELKKNGVLLVKETQPILDHAEAVKILLNALIKYHVLVSLDEIDGIGHRVVQGGKYFNGSALFDKDTEDKIESLIPLAPLHNGAHLVGFRAFRKVLPHVRHVAVFDTSFHQTMSPVDFLYPLPYEYYEKYDVRRYGAHGTSHQYLAMEAKKYFTKESGNKIISCHLGSGASLCAIIDNKCITTSMGFTPLAGVMMGTRTGDIDPSIMPYLIKQTGLTADEIYDVYNKKSGLLGVSGVSNDTRDIIKAVESGNTRAALANDIFVRRIVGYIGQYFALLGGCDILIFSAGIGENVGYYRQKIVDGLKEAFGVEIDEVFNAPLREKEAVISTKNSKIKIVIIPTNEELMIARDTVQILAL